MRTRAQALHALSSHTFDVLVIGGGITGAGIARDAAMRGLTVALIDKGDFASGTSSRSSRLIHGGVRYLEHGYLHLVFEASAERRRLLRIAPHLVRPLPFTWPVYSGQRLPLWKLAAGLTLYDLLSLFRNVGRHRRLSAREVLAAEPRLRTVALRGGVRYFDAATDDARLTLANVVDAERHGAIAANHVVFTGLDENLSCLEDTLTGQRIGLVARVRVNATGPWSDTVDALHGVQSTGKGRIQGSKGSHIAVSRERVGNHDAVTMLHPRDGRVMFALPAGGNTIVGTTDTFTSVSPDEVRADEGDVAYLLEAANAYFPDARLARTDVLAAWAGIRPLMPTAGSSVAASREHAIRMATDRVVSITGGKLTTYRVMARQVVDVVQKTLHVRAKPAATDSLPLPDAANEIAACRERDALHREAIVAGLPYRMGDMRWAVEREFACTLGDLLMRRTHIAFETRDNGRSAARGVADFVAPLFGWDAPQRDRELARYDAEAERIFRIDR